MGEEMEDAMDTYDVTVRIPVAFSSGAEAAGFIESAVRNAMKDGGLHGSPYVIWRDDDGTMRGFLDGEGAERYEGVAPHYRDVGPEIREEMRVKDFLDPEARQMVRSLLTDAVDIDARPVVLHLLDLIDLMDSPHHINFDEGGWFLEHSLKCRVATGLNCEIHRSLHKRDFTRLPIKAGRYAISMEKGVTDEDGMTLIHPPGTSAATWVVADG